jgi:hypothetical protein
MPGSLTTIRQSNSWLELLVDSCDSGNRKKINVGQIHQLIKAIKIWYGDKRKTTLEKGSR